MPNFSPDHRARFKELRATGEVYAFNLNPESSPWGPWIVQSDVHGEDGSERLVSRFQSAVRTAALAVDFPARVNLTDWWIWRLAGRRKRFRLEGLVQRSVELCEVFESKSAELRLVCPARGIEAGLRRDRY